MYTAALLLLVIGSCAGGPQQRIVQDYDYLYEDLVSPNLQQQQVAVVQTRQRAPQQLPTQSQPIRREPAPQQQRIAIDDSLTTTTTPVPIIKDIRRTDPSTGAFIYEYMGADGTGKYEIRFLNGTVLGNYTYINDQNKTETRWYSAGDRGTEIGGDGVISPAPPTLIDETTGPNYVDLSNYDLYRHLEVPYVHIDGPSDPDERGQLSNPDRVRSSNQERPRSNDIRPQVQQSSVPIDFGDDVRFARVNQQAAPVAPAELPQRPIRVSRTRVRVSEGRPQAQSVPVQFNTGAIDGSSPDAVLDSIIRQFQ